MAGRSVAVWIQMAPRCLTRRLLSRIGQSSRAQSAANSMQPRRTCPGTNRRIVASTLNRQRSAFTVAKRMWACQHWRCTCWPTSWPTAAASVARCSPGLGCYKAIWEVTRERSHTGARIAAKRSPTGRIYVPTCRRIPRTRTTSARDATKPSLSSPIWTNTWSPLVYATTRCRRNNSNSNLLPMVATRRRNINRATIVVCSSASTTGRPRPGASTP